jgi:hypothetical protein
VETPPTQMSLLKSNKKLASDVVVLPTAKVAPAPETIVEVLPHTDGPRFNLQDIQYSGQKKKKTKGQTMMYKTLHRNLN